MSDRSVFQAPGGGGGGVTDHGALTGLGDDDHPQYATDTDLTTHAATPHGGPTLPTGAYFPDTWGNQYITLNTRGDAFRFVLPFAMTAAKIAVHIGTASANNFDVGIYNAAGTSKLASSGAVAATGLTAGVLNEIPLLANAVLAAGVYWIAVGSDGVGAQYAAGLGDAAHQVSKYLADVASPLPASISGWTANALGRGPTLVAA